MQVNWGTNKRNTKTISTHQRITSPNYNLLWRAQKRREQLKKYHYHY